MSPVVDCDIKEEIHEEIDNSLLTIAISPSSADDHVSECPPTPDSNHFSNSFPSCSVTRALRDVQPDDVKVDRLSTSCFADLQLDKFADDGDLTSLDWLQDINLLRNISPDRPHGSDLDGAQKENSLMSAYHPKRNPYGKPPYSFSVLIFMAIESSPQRQLPVKGIYQWIADQFPFYRRAPLGWRNSVRHNLSLNKCFRKVEKEFGKGSSWCVDPLFRPNLLQAMKRTPYFPFQQIQMTSVATTELLEDDDLTFMNVNDYECQTSAFETLPRLLPLPSRRQRTSEADMDVATTLASLRDARSSTILSNHEQKLLKIRSEANLPELMCTPPPSKDHIYGYAEWLIVEAQQAALAVECDVESPVDEVYDFGEICCDIEASTSDSYEALSDIDSVSSGSPGRRVISRHSWMKLEDDVVDEERRRLEGVRALLNLASGSKVDRMKKSSRLPMSGSLWAKAVSTRLKKQKKRLGKVPRERLNKSKVKRKRKVARKRTK